MTADPVRDSLVQLLSRCVDDPGLFNTAILGRSPFWWRQEEIARSVVHYRETAVYSGNAIGKDYLVGSLVPWWLCTRADSLVIVTGPSQTVLGSVTWKEIRRAIEGSRIPLGARISKGVKASPQVVELAPGWTALGYSTTSVERASGQHARKVLVIVEEASGLEDEQWGALQSLKANRTLAIGNPIRSEGGFLRLIRQAEEDFRDKLAPSKACNAIQVPSTDSPHADLDESPFGLADKTWLEAEIRRHGADSLWVRSHIRAEIPSVSFDALISEAWLDHAAAVGPPAVPIGHPMAGRRRISCDLGEGVGRDSSAIFCRDDLRLIDFRGGNAMGLAEAAQAIAELRTKWKVDDANISYDKLGIGKNFPHHLARHGITGAVGYAGEARPRSSEFTNLRTEAAWNVRNRLCPDHTPDLRSPHTTQRPFFIPPGPYWERLRTELKALTYDLVGRQTRLIPKKDLMTRLGCSPDFADAFCQLFAF
jgi:hypothetical protein